jgi:hypothetical protein
MGSGWIVTGFLDTCGALLHNRIMPTYAPNNNLTIDVRHVGASREPILIIDDFLANPEALVAEAAGSQDWHDVAPGGYPGKRAPLPRAYAQAVLRRLDVPIRQRLVGKERSLKRFDCSFSLVTAAPSDLAPLQRVPHIDVADENRVAILHYLCSDRFGGTAFFRQVSTGLEQITAAEKARYIAARREDLATHQIAGAYPSETTGGYERTGKVDARFNRIVAYRSMTLHSGIIDEPGILSDDPAKGRLTANFFVEYR